VTALGRVRAPASLPDTRLPFERNVFQVTARVTFVRLEDDTDFHLVLRDGSAQMIAESPLPVHAVRRPSDADRWRTHVRWFESVAERG